MRFKSLSIFITLLTLFPVLSFAAGKKITKIVLDAGHGGKDGGARGAYSNEKDLTLAIVLKLGKIINDSMRTVTPLYTRVEDVFPSLQDRHEVANQASADLFISVHINSTPFRTERVQTGTRTIRQRRRTVTVPTYTIVKHHTTTHSGTESYVLGSIRNTQKEKAFGEFGDRVVDEPGLLNENDPQTAIIISQYTKAFLGRSVSLATKIQEAFVAQGRNDDGVKQKSLEVLAGSYMPGVLVECGFITNPNEEEYMNSDRGQTEIAMAIYRGIKAYKQEVEK